MEKLRTGIIGIGGYGGDVLAQLARNDNFRVQAVADRDRELACETARLHNAEPYDDYRRLIVEQKLDVLFLTLPTFLCGECLQLAARAGMHVFKEAPLARSLPEATQWIRLMKKARCRFHIAAPKRFAPGYLEARRLLDEGAVGTNYLVRAEYFTGFQGTFDWRGDPVLAGGGVLLEMAYHLIDQIVWNLGAPETIYSVNTNRCSKRVLPPYRTEDTVVLTIKFPDGAMGNLMAGWMTGPETERLLWHGTDGSLEAGPDYLRLYDVDGRVIRDETYRIDQAELISRQITHFAQCLNDVDTKPVSPARVHLVNVAVIESAYLSARTQLPETLKVYGSVFEI